MKSILYLLLLPLAAYSQTYQHGRVVVHPSNHYFQYEDGSPFFYLGDTDWELFHRCSREEAHLIIKNRAQKGYTVLQAVILAESNGLNDPNVYGEKPLIDNDPLKPNEAYFQHVDYIIKLADAYGLTVGLLPTWGDKLTPNNGAGPVIFTDTTVAFKYGEYLGKRYKNYKNIIWVMGGDRYWDGYEPIWRAMAKGVTIGTSGKLDYSKTTITLHPDGGGTSSRLFHNEPWLDFNMLQTGHCYAIPSYDKINADYLRKPTKPVLDGEPLYEEHPICFNAPMYGFSNDFHVRRFIYHNVFAGAAGHTYGCHAIWQMYLESRYPINGPRRNWIESLNLPGAFQMGYARWLMESRPYFSRIPDQTMIISEVGKENDRITATRDSLGTYAFIYSEQGRTFTLNLKKLSAKFIKSYWFDPRTGNGEYIETFKNIDTKTFNPPTQGIGNDWVLIVDDAAKNYPIPSKPKGLTAKIAPPTNIKAGITGANFISISWQPGVEKTAYFIYTNDIFAGATTENSFCIDGLKPETAYKISVKSSVSINESGPSEVVNVSTSKPILATSFSAISPQILLKAGRQQYVTTKTLPENVSSKSVQWNSSDTSVATINNDGFVAAKNPGTATVTGTKIPENISTKVKIDVSLPTETFEIKKTSESYIIDGELKETFWDMPYKLTNNIQGTSDNQVKFGLAWNEKYLLVGIKVLDKNVINNGGSPWDNDDIEIFIDGNHDHKTSLNNAADRQFLIQIDDDLYEQRDRIKGVKYAVSRTLGGYDIEMAIPFESMLLKPKVGMLFGFDISNSDYDNASHKNKQLIVWKGGADNWANSDKYATMILK